MTLQTAIKKAKIAIQKSQLDPVNTVKRETALQEMAIANQLSREQNNRLWWKNEILIKPHYSLQPDSWYIETKTVQWGIDNMPEWAQNGKIEPDLHVSINGIAYTEAPKSASR